MKKSLEAVGADCLVTRLRGNTLMCALRLLATVGRLRDRDLMVSFFVSSVGLLVSLFVGRVMLGVPVLFYLGGDPFFTGVESSSSRSGSRLLCLIRRFLTSMDHAVHRFAIRRADGLVVVSRELGAAVVERCGSCGTVIVVPPAADKVRSFQARPHRSLGRDSEVELLMVTNLSFESKFEGALEVIDGLMAAASSWEGSLALGLAGGGRFLPALESRIAAMELPSNLHLRLLGFVEDVEALYPRADVFVYSTRFDSHPNVLLEAMSFGLPILMVELAAFQSIMTGGRNARFFRPDDPRDFAARLVELLEDDAGRRAMSETNVRDVRDLLDHGRIGRRLRIELERLSAASGRGDA